MDLCSARWDDLQAEIESRKTRFVPSAQPPSAQPPAAARFAPLRGTQPQRCAALCCAALRAAPLGALYMRAPRAARAGFLGITKEMPTYLRGKEARNEYKLCRTQTRRRRVGVGVGGGCRVGGGGEGAELL